MKNNALSLAFYLFLIVGLPRLISLDAHWSNDETLWLHRSAQFMNAVRAGQFEQVLITHHPGVTTLWLGGLRQFFGNTEIWLSLKSLAITRWFIGAIVSTGLTAVFFLLCRLFRTWQAIAAWSFLAVNPFLLSQTRRVHTDALATIFILLTVLLFLLFCVTSSRSEHHLQKRGYLVFAGVAFGFACLSKSYSLILLPWLPFCLWLFRPTYMLWREFLRCVYIKGVFFFSCSLLTVFLIWPIFWNPLGICLTVCLLGITILLQRTVQTSKHAMICVGFATSILIVCIGYAVKKNWVVFVKIRWALTIPHEIDHFFFGEILADPGWLFYLFTFSIKSTSLVLPLAMGAAVFLWKHKQDENTRKHLKIAIALGAVAVLFTIFLSLTSKKFARYLLPAFPMIDILAGLGLFYTMKWIGTRFKKQHCRRAAYAGCVFFALILTAGPVFALHPHYGTHYNLYWKVTDIAKIITVNDTSSLEIAAKYLNKKTNAAQMSVHVSYLGAEFFRYYFSGTVYQSDNNRIERTDKLRPPDYEVVYIRDLQIERVPPGGTHNGELEHTITLNGLDHAWIYRIPRQEE